MKIIIHRGTHQIGGVATEISTEHTRIIIDMGDELSLDSDFVSEPLNIPGVTNENGHCDAVLFTHNHGDHIAQIRNVRKGIPLYMGDFARAVLLEMIRNATPETIEKIKSARMLIPGKQFVIGDIKITPFSVDHSALDSFMFLIEAEGVRILHTGDFRFHGFRGKGLPKIIKKLIVSADVLITEGTTLSRNHTLPLTEHELQQKAAECISKYKYVFVLASTTNLERICGLSKITPRGKHFVCDEYQAKLLSLTEQKLGHYSSLYRNIKKTVYGDNLFEQLQKRGFVMMVRDNPRFRRIVSMFDPSQSIILYSMWDGYRTRPGSTIPDFLSLSGTWSTLHTSGHASAEDIVQLIKMVSPNWIIPIHTEQPEILKELCSEQQIVFLEDGEKWSVIKK